MSRVFLFLFRLPSRLATLWNRRSVRLGVTLLVAFWTVDTLVCWIADAQWFDALGYGAMWRRRILLQAALFFGAGIASLLWLGLPLRAALNVSGPRLRLPARYKMVQNRLQAFPRRAARIGWWVVLLVAIVTARGFARHWDTGALFFAGGDFGTRDPHFGRDIGFYVFRLPAWHLLVDAAWKLTTLAFLLTAAVALVTGAAQLLSRRPGFSRSAGIWLAILGATWFGLRAVGCILTCYDLATLSHPGAVVAAGVSFVDWHVRRPLLLGGAVLNGVTALLLLAMTIVGGTLRPARRNRARRAIVACGTAALVAPTLLLWIVPGVVFGLVVLPDEMQREQPFIAAHLNLTRAAWGLDAIVPQFGPSNATPISSRTRPQVSPSFPASVVSALRVWDAPHLLDAAQGALALPAPYRFDTLHLERYQINGRPTLVGIAACEPDAATSDQWLSHHVLSGPQQASGVGVFSATEATAGDVPGAPIAWLKPPIASQRGTPADRATNGPGSVLALRDARLFFGALPNDYAITDDAGVGDVSLGSFWQRVLWAWYWRDLNLLLHAAPASAPRLLARRAMSERAAALAPFLVPGGEPYPVVHDGHIMWMLDLLATTTQYPGATPAACGVPGESEHAGESGEDAAASGPFFNAARDSVKMTMDAVSGRVAFYAAGEASKVGGESRAGDPWRDAWERVFPGLVQSFSAMPPDLAAHRRYPRALFAAQQRILERYHDVAPDTFYAHGDDWQTVRQARDNQAVPQVVPPAYALLPSLGGATSTDSLRFVLQGALGPAGKPDLAALLQAECDGPRYGRLSLLRFTMPGGALGASSGFAHDALPGPESLATGVLDVALSRSFSSLPDEATGQWHVRGDVLVVPLAPGASRAGGRLLLVAPIYTEAVPSGAMGDDSAARNTRLWRVVVADAGVAGLIHGIGRTAAEALDDLAKREAGVARPSDERADLASQALHAEEAAQDAARRADWARAGVEWNRLHAILRQMAAER